MSRGHVGHLIRPPALVSFASELRRMTCPHLRVQETGSVISSNPEKRRDGFTEQQEERHTYFSTTGGLSRSASSLVTGHENREWKVNSGGSDTSAGSRSPSLVQSPSDTTTASIFARMGTNCRPATKATSKWLCIGRPSASQPTSRKAWTLFCHASSLASVRYGDLSSRPAHRSAPMHC
eukprot:scaffold327_cov257-Pinguiococcus_pyrenoidosus.AAC.14